MSIGLFVLAVVSGMLGIGVAFAAIPFLSFFLPDLVHQVQPLSRHVPERQLKRIFGILIVLVTVYRLVTLKV